MSLRLRLVLAAAAIVAISLILSAALSWLLVSNLEFESARADLDRLAITTRQSVLRSQCNGIPAAPNAVACSGRPQFATRDLYEERLRTLGGSGGDRLLLLNARRQVVFDSGNPAPAGETITLNRVRRIDNEATNEGDIQLGGDDFLAGGVALPRDPILNGRYLVLARRASAVNAAAASSLGPRLLLAGAVALVLAVLIALLFSRAFTRPLTELALAAGDVAAGRYSRRVAISGGDEIGTLGAAFNRMAEAVQRSREQQRDFLANVSHELKTPLTSLIGFSLALRDGTLKTPHEKRRAATIIHEEAHRVLRMSQELLDLARVEAGQVSYHPSPVDLGALLEQELEVVRHRADERGLALALHAPDSMPPVRADPERLHQIVDNLLDNAVKYAPAGSPVRVEVTPAPGAVEVSVVNRVGEHPPDPGRMFERFYRADPSRSGAGGVGLGLAISRELASGMGARLFGELSDSTLRMRLVLPAT